MLKKVETETKADELVQLFLEVRDELAFLDQQYKEARAVLERNWERLEIKALAFLQRTGQTNAKTDYGTLYKRIDTRINVSDPQRFIDHVLTNPEENIFLMEHRACKTACQDWIREHNKDVPGVQIKHEAKIGVRKAS